MSKGTKLARTEVTRAMAKPMEPWEQELAAKAKDAQAAEIVGVPRIQHRGGILKVDDKPVEGNKLRVVIVAYGRQNVYFEQEYNSNTSKGETPDCYAFGPSTPGAEEEMRPHPAAPHPQAGQCMGCRWNEFGSGKGNAKKCANQRKLLVVVPTANSEGLAKAQVRQISVPPGTLRAWGNYLSSELPEVTPFGPMGVITEISTEPLDTGAYRLTFKAVDRLDSDFVKALAAKAVTLERHLSEPFPVVSKKEEEAPKPKRKIKGQ